MCSEIENKTELSVIVSVFNEEDVLEKFFEAAAASLNELGKSYELIFVNDGSTDRSREIVGRFADENSNVRVLNFSCNFGHEAAMLAGIDHARGKYLICMDADLQHPVEYIPEIFGKLENGKDIINMVRTSNDDAGFFKNITSSLFYSILNSVGNINLEKNASDFFGISQRVADVLRNEYRERVRFIRGYVQTVGFSKDKIEYEAADRAGGKSKYSIRKLSRFSIETLVSFSDAPLKLGIYAGIIALIIGFVMAIYTIVTWIKVGAPNGYSTIVVLMCFMFGVVFLLLGVIGMYISVLFKEVKGRPIYIIEEEL
ncbi:MAG: glycosyltransferase family 2 protein [Lachnospiraceae bacterium]|nr:glycosyltransferase family 2 protein [Lachnospiraceae bacterium]